MARKLGSMVVYWCAFATAKLKSANISHMNVYVW